MVEGMVGRFSARMAFTSAMRPTNAPLSAEEIKRRNSELQQTIERMFSELSGVKTDRNLLAGLFIEVAKCLNQDVTPKIKAAAESVREWSAS